METIDTDLPCARCGYNLRTLRREGVCPECGELVRPSEIAAEQRRQGHVRLRERGLPWMRSVREAITLGFAAWGIACFSAFTMPMHGPREAIDLLLPAAAFGMSCFAAWRLFSAESGVSRWGGRAVTGLTVATVLASGIDDRWASHYFGTTGPLPWPLGNSAFSIAKVIASGAPIIICLAAIAVVAGLARCCWLAQRYILMSETVIFGISPIAIAVLFEVYPSHLGFRAGRLLGLCTLMSIFGLPILLACVRYTFTRAIRLGGLPAASSRSSPSPRPPA